MDSTNSSTTDGCSTLSSEGGAAIGSIIDDRYKLISLIATGGMSQVYQAEQLPLGRIVAVKVMVTPDGAHFGVSSSQGSSSATFEKRLLREAAVCARLRHPNTITLYDYGRTPHGICYIVMELLDGKSLSSVLKDEGALALERALHISAQVARSLREAHRFGVVHRDIKPGNLHLLHREDDSNFVKVLDFGLVKSVSDENMELTKTGFFVGTPRYMSPEQIRGENVDARSDVYSLGIVLYEMLCGKRPFDARSAMDVAAAHLVETPPDMGTRNPAVSVPEPLRAFVTKCIAKDAAARFPSMDSFLAGLFEAAEYSGIHVTRAAGDRSSSSVSNLSIPSAALERSNTHQSRLGNHSLAESQVSHGYRNEGASGTAPRRRLLPIAGGVLALVIMSAGLAWVFKGDGIANERTDEAEKAALVVRSPTIVKGQSAPSAAKDVVARTTAQPSGTAVLGLQRAPQKPPAQEPVATRKRVEHSSSSSSSSSRKRKRTAQRPVGRKATPDRVRVSTPSSAAGPKSAAPPPPPPPPPAPKQAQDVASSGRAPAKGRAAANEGGNSAQDSRASAATSGQKASNPAEAQRADSRARATSKRKQTKEAPKMGFLDISSETPSYIFIDGVKTGAKTPAKIAVAPGSHTVSVVMKSRTMNQLSYRVQVKAGKTVKLRFTREE